MVRRMLLLPFIVLVLLGGCGPDHEAATNPPNQRELGNPQQGTQDTQEKAQNQAGQKNPGLQPTEDQAGSFPYQIDVLDKDLNVPWEMDIASDGRIFFTERPGVIRVIDQKGVLLDEPVLQFQPPFISQSEGGLLGLILDPNFEHNHYLYVYHSYQEGNEIRNRVLRLIEKKNKAVVDRVLIDHLPGASYHNGGRIKIGPDGYLYITTGERYKPPLAQDLNNLGGKILRITLEGEIPKDNPFPGSPVYSWGHRNPQGLAWHPETNRLYASEHGQSAHDEINVIEAGANYGWPLIQGDETSKENPDLKRPILHSGKQTWAPSGITFVHQGPWKGQLLVANLRGQKVLKITLEEQNPTKVKKAEPLFTDWGRIRNVYEGKDGTLYIMTNNRDGRGKAQKGDDKIFRLRLKEGR